MLRLGSLEGAPTALDRGAPLRPRELHGDPHGRHLRAAHADHRLDLGQGLVGCLVVVGREAARAVPDPVPLLLVLLHAPLLDRLRPPAGAKLGGVRAVRGRPDPGQLPGCADRGDDPAPDDLHARGRGSTRRDARGLLRLPGGHALAGRDPVPRRAGREAGRREPARAQGAPRVTTSEKYVTAAYLVLLGALLVYLLIIALKVGRLEEELADLTRAAREKLGG